MTGPLPLDATSINVAGIQGVVTQNDYTSPQVFSTYEQQVNSLYNLLTNSAPASSTTAGQIQSAVSTLISLLENGMTVPANQTSSTLSGIDYQSYMTGDMATNLQLLFGALQSAGINPDATLNVSTTEAQSLKNLVNSSQILQPLFTFVAQGTNQSLQTMIELDYVQTGNQVMSSQLSSLQTALQTTQTVLNTLTDLQNVQNEVTINNLSSFTSVTGFTLNPAPNTIGASAFESAFVSAASAYWGAAIVPETTLFPSNPEFGWNVANPIPAGAQAIVSKVPNGITGNEPTVSTIGGLIENIVNINGNNGIAITTKNGAGNTVAEALAENPGMVYAHDTGNGIYSLYSDKDSWSAIQFSIANPSQATVHPFLSGVIIGDGNGTTQTLRFDHILIAGSANGNPAPFNPTFATTYGFETATGETISIPSATGRTGTVSASYYWTSNSSPTSPATFSTLWKQQTVIENGTFNPLGLTEVVIGGTGYNISYVNGNSQAVQAALKLFTAQYGNEIVSGLIPTTNTSSWVGYDPTTNKIQVSPDPLSSFTNAKNQLVSYASTLSAQLTLLSAQTTFTNGVADPNSIYAQVKQVLTDLDETFKTASGGRITYSTSVSQAYTGFVNWMLDGYNLPQSNPNAANAGSIQNHITEAITAGQSLNNTQTENVREYLFIFEEYYKSAGQLLQQITQIIQQMAQNISK